MINNNFQNYLDLDLFISYPNIDIFLGGGLEELKAEAVGELLAPLVADDPLVLHVALVAHQDHLRVVPAVRLDLGAPEKLVRFKRSYDFIVRFFQKHFDILLKHN